MLNDILSYKTKVDSGEIIFDSNYEYFITKKIFLLKKGEDKQYNVVIDYATNNTMKTIRDSNVIFEDFENAFNYYLNIDTTHNIYTKEGKAKIEQDKSKQPKVLFPEALDRMNELLSDIEIVDVNQVVLPETGNTYRQTNLEKKHSIPLGSLVELEDGVRLYVVGHPRDFDGTPLYNLCFDKNWKEEEDYKLGDQVILAKMMSRKMLVMHYPKESLKLIRSSFDETYDEVEWDEYKNSTYRDSRLASPVLTQSEIKWIEENLCRNLYKDSIYSNWTNDNFNLDGSYFQCWKYPESKEYSGGVQSAGFLELNKVADNFFYFAYGTDRWKCNFDGLKKLLKDKHILSDDKPLEENFV